jgi:hypothetical protein
LLCLISSLSFATVKITSVTGVSKVVNETDGSVTIYGGIQAGNVVSTAYRVSGGDSACSATAGACDTCIGNAANATVRQAPCNLAGVFKETILTITGSQTTNLANGKFFLCNGATEIDSTLNLSEALTLTWEELCEDMSTGANTDCAVSNISQTLTFGVGTDCNNIGAEKTNLKVVTRIINIDPATDDTAVNTYTPPPAAVPPTPDACVTSKGACYFKTYPGDGKVFLDPDVGVGIASDFPATDATGVVYEKLVLFYLETGTAPTDTSNDINTFNTITTNNNLGFITVASNGDVSTAALTGLENEKRYCFKMGSQDSTGNIDHISSQDCDVTYNPDFATPACNTVCASPSEVVGLLSDTSCFIATAAFGSRLDPHVQLLRDFKNRFLINNDLGRKVVKIYYSVSPDLAKWISQNETLRSAVRTALWPVVWIVQIVMYFGFSILLLPVGLLGGAFVFRRWRQAA